jgi:hypothetical protein
MKMAVFWVVAPRRLVRVYQSFGGLYCLHHQGADSAFGKSVEIKREQVRQGRARPNLWDSQ